MENLRTWYNSREIFLEKNMSQGDLNKFCDLVSNDQNLQSQLEQATSMDDLLALAVSLGESQNLHFTEDEVRGKIQDVREDQEIIFPIQDILDGSGSAY